MTSSDGTSNRLETAFAHGASAMNHGISLGVAILLLAGCGGASMSPDAASVPVRAPERAVLVPGAKHQDLLYVTDAFNYGTIDVYTYPGGKSAYKIHSTASGFPLGMCVDNAGNVYVTSEYGDISEYPHGGKTPVNSWSIFSSTLGCSVDPTNGNVAVAIDGGKGRIYVVDPAGTQAAYYSSPGFTPYWCGYDPHGNLFAEGFAGKHGRFHLAFYELAKGGSSLKKIALQVAGAPTGVQWDGKYMTAGVMQQGVYNYINQLKISGGKATVVGSTRLATASNANWNTRNYFVVVRGDNQGTGVVSTALNQAGTFNYPSGGMPLKVFNLHSTTSAVVSLAQKPL
jgi:hypothetical protein